MQVILVLHAATAVSDGCKQLRWVNRILVGKLINDGFGGVENLQPAGGGLMIFVKQHDWTSVSDKPAGIN